MLIALSLLKVRDGHLDQLLEMLNENMNTTEVQKGNVGNYIAKGTDNDEVLLFSLWQSKDDYESAKKVIKKQYKKDLFYFLSHMAKQPKIQVFETV